MVSPAFGLKAVFAVRRPGSPGAAIAIQPRAVCGGTVVTWHDTIRDHRVAGRLHARDEGRFELETPDGVWCFDPLTREVFDREIRPGAGPTPVFASDEALVQFYLERF